MLTGTGRKKIIDICLTAYSDLITYGQKDLILRIWEKNCLYYWITTIALLNFQINGKSHNPITASAAFNNKSCVKNQMRIQFLKLRGRMGSSWALREGKRVQISADISDTAGVVASTSGHMPV